MKQPIAIAGGGIGGLTTAIALQRKGLEVKVFESAPVIKPLGAGLALAGNAVKALQQIGIADEVVRRGQKLKVMYGKDEKGRVISLTNTEKLTEQFGVLNNFTIHRADLHESLSALLQPGTLETGHTLTDFEQDQNGVTLHFANGMKANASALIAADGIHSVVRKKLLPAVNTRYAGYTCWRGVIDSIPKGASEDETIESWGSGRRFGIVPIGRQRLYWFATLNAPAMDQSMKSCGSRELIELFKSFHAPVSEILKRTPDDKIIWSDIIDIAPIKRFAFDRVVLMGDAAHATTPNMGQGACMAIEDAATLAFALEKYPVAEAFQRFERHRIPRTTSIVNQSWNLGKMAQVENRWLMKLRDGAMRMVPLSVIDKQLRKLFDVTFEC